MALPPGPRAPSPVQTLQFLARPTEMLIRWQRRYGDMATVKFAGFGRGVYVSDPEVIRELFTGDQSDLHAGDANSFLAPIVGRHSVLVLDGPEHLRQRKLLLPPFQGSRVAAFREIVRDAAHREVDRWRPGQELVLRDRMRALTFDVICHAVFGVYEPERVERLRTALSAVIDTPTLVMAVAALRADLGPWSPGGKLKRRLEAADALIYEEIEWRRGEPDLAERTDVLSLLLSARDEDGQPMTDTELRDELVTMLGAGHETTATALSFGLDHLLHNPETLARLRAEIEENGGDAWLEAVMRETMRLTPVIDAAQRTLTKPRRVGGWDLPAGIKVYPAIMLVHRRADLYPDPERFKPERFLGRELESYAWLPFGGGIRRCIGAALAQAEMIEALRVIVPRAELAAVRPEPDPVRISGITLAPKHGVRVRVRSVGPAPSAQLDGDALQQVEGVL
jgi:cytochrome P450